MSHRFHCFYEIFVLYKMPVSRGKHVKDSMEFGLVSWEIWNKNTIPLIAKLLVIRNTNFKIKYTSNVVRVFSSIFWYLRVCNIPLTNSSRDRKPSPSLSCRRKKSVIRNFLAFIQFRYFVFQTSKSKVFNPSNWNIENILSIFLKMTSGRGIWTRIKRHSHLL